MKDKAVLYLCDPEKNVYCRKNCCAYKLTRAEGGVCTATFRREFAREYSDGSPMIYERKERKNVSGADS